MSGVAVAALCAFSLTLEGAPAGRPDAVAVKRQADEGMVHATRDLQRPVSSVPTNTDAASSIVFGKVPEGTMYPDADVVIVDYRNDPMSQARARGELVGPWPGPSWPQGGVAAGGCSFDIECDDGDPCTLDVCNLVAGQPAGSGKCENVPISDGNVGGCDDGLFCNGQEVCMGGSCVAGTPISCPGGETCNEHTDSCQPTCVINADCNDGNPCTDLVCVSGSCLPNPANYGNPCGANATCSSTTCNNGAACTANSDCLTGQTCEERGQAGCYLGRCCTTTDGGVTWTCNKRLRSACTGNWFAGDSGQTPGSFTCSPALGGCPKYGAGIGPHGDFIQVVGPISDSPATVPPFGGPLNRLGDDYEISNGSHIAMNFLRFVGGMIVPERLLVEFFDDDGNFVEDVFFIINDGQMARRTIQFVPPLTIPPKGFVVMSIMENFSPNARFAWASTDVVDAGINDPGVLWVNLAGFPGTPVTSNPLSPDPGVMVFEIVGSKVPAPVGACCDKATSACSQQVSWICTGNEGVFNGVGAECRVCSAASINVGQVCTDDTDCRTCDENSGGLAGNPCNDSSECGGGNCVGFCEDLAACLTGACCDPDNGDCALEDQTTCATLSHTFRGFGTDCDPNCCQLPPAAYTGADDCEDAEVTANEVTIPSILDGPIVVTITGDNTDASSTIANPDSCNPPSGDTQSDPGWWEAIKVNDNIDGDDCFFMMIDHCCSDPVWRPAYRVIYDRCPCGPAIFSRTNPNKPDLLDVARGAPFCDEDNLWSLYGPLKSGTYFYPIYSALQGQHGKYQLHITVEACPKAACCVGDDCDLMNQIQCSAAGGYFLAPPNMTDATIICTGATCATGSCCTGPGECLDNDGVGSPMDPNLCQNILGGKYVGGVKCFGGTCSNDATAGCISDEQCPGGTCVGDSAALAQTPACPICEIEGATNCQPWEDDIGISVSDRAAFSGGELVTADDFRPTANTIRTACVWGSYFDLDPDTARSDCGDLVSSDNFLVRVYADNNDLPGSLIAESEATSVRAIINQGGTQLCVVLGNNCIETYGYQLELSDDIVLPVADGNTTYWIEISNDLGAVSDCVWVWHTLSLGSAFGNGYAATGSGGTFQPVSVDQAFCLAGPDGAPLSFTAPDTPERACCSCAGGCSEKGLRDCNSETSSWHYSAPTCGSITCPVGAPANDDCNTPTDVTDFGDPHAGTVTIGTDINCATTDGFNPIETDFGLDAAGPDTWYTFTPSEDCNLTVSMCGTGFQYDSLVALYSLGAGQPCVCPNNATDSEASFIEGADETCIGAALGGAGFITTQAVADACYVIRVAAWAPGGTRGTGILDVTCSTATAPDPLEPDPAGPPGGLACTAGSNYGLDCQRCSGGTRNGLPCIVNSDCSGGGTCSPSAGACPGGSCGLQLSWVKNRFIGVRAPFAATAGTTETAIRLRLVDVAGNSACNGEVRWAQAPATFNEGAVGTPTFRAALLGSDPVWHDWGAEGLVYLYGQEIIPGSRYEAQLVSISCQSTLENEDCYSSPLVVATAKWGDVVLPMFPFTGAAQPDVSDVSALVAKFGGAPGAIVKARAKLQPRDMNPALPVDVSDISGAVSGFQGNPYPHSVPSCTP